MEEIRLDKDKRVNIRISAKDLDEIQTLAIENGIPYINSFPDTVFPRTPGRFRG